MPPDENDLVKRVIAVGGQTVECRVDTGLTVDGKPLHQPFLDPQTMDADPAVYPCLGSEFGPVKVPEERLWVMGDNRTHSADSRAHCTSSPRKSQEGIICTGDPNAGTVPVDNVIGKARFIAWPPGRWSGAAAGRIAVPAPRRRAGEERGGRVDAADDAEVRAGRSEAGDRGRRAPSSASRRVCERWSRRCIAAASARWPASTRWDAAPAPARWWWRPACWDPTGSTAWRRSTIPRSSTEKERERLFPLIKRYALAYHVVFIPSVEVDRRGVHVANIEGMRRAVAGLPMRPGYVLSDGFRVPGLPAPSLPVIGGDAAAACIAAASVLAKVSRDRLMVAMDARYPGYGFAEHKGYSTLAHFRRARRTRPVRRAPVFVHQCPQGRDTRRAWVGEDGDGRSEATGWTGATVNSKDSRTDER